MTSNVSGFSSTLALTLSMFSSEHTECGLPVDGRLITEPFYCERAITFPVIVAECRCLPNLQKIYDMHL